MKDNSFQLDIFNDTYKSATAAADSGDIQTAKRDFKRCAELMRDIAENSDEPLKSTRLKRAEKLDYIADNLIQSVKSGNSVAADTADTGNGDEFIHIVKPSESITFNDVIGLDEAKRAIRKLLIDPLKNPDVYKKYGLKAGGFVLLEGPPGTGKTTFAKAAAAELEVPFAEVNANELIDSYIGKTGKNIDALFGSARKISKKHGTPIVLFIDEIDYIAQKRGGENKTANEAVPTLIKQMDGFSTDSQDIVLIAATNIKETLDPAVLSRFRNRINIPLPTLSERQKIFALKLKSLDGADFSMLDLETAARISDGFSGRDIAQTALDLKTMLAERDAGIAPLPKPLSECLNDLIVQRATTL